MSILKIARLGHPILLQKTKPVKNFAEEQLYENFLNALGISLEGEGDFDVEGWLEGLDVEEHE